MRIALVFCRIDDLFQNYEAGVFSIFESNPPLGLCAIGTVAVHRQHDVKIFDQLLHDYDNNELIKWVDSYNPDVIGFSCTSLNINNSEYCAKALKKDNRKVFAGGIHITLCATKVFNSGAFDFLISGEGEEVFDKVLEKIENKQSLDSLTLPGLWTDSSIDNGVAVLGCIDLPILDRSIMEMQLYKNKGALLKEQPCYSIFSSRGCPFTCKFCSKPDYFKLYRQRNVENVIGEIHYLINNWGAKCISFREDNFTVDLERLSLFCDKMIEEFKGDFFWECESRANLPKAVLRHMYEAGCRGIWCGVETVVPRWSKWINKGLSRQEVEKFYFDCQSIGIKTGALFMFGFPEQTEEELEDDISFAINLPTEFSAFQCLAIFPGSPLSDYYSTNPELKREITPEVALALTRGKNYEEMIDQEHSINRRIKSNRIEVL